MKLKDRYGDHGYISLIMIEKISHLDFFLVNYLMSCRILGRELEIWFLINICKKLLKNDKNKLIMEYIPSRKNIIIKDFLEKNKFNKLDNYSNYGFKFKNGNQFYQLQKKDLTRF